MSDNIENIEKIFKLKNSETSIWPTSSSTESAASESKPGEQHYLTTK